MTAAPRSGPSAGVLLGIAFACAVAVTAALVSQHMFDMQPCPWCVLQRLIFVVIAIVAFLGALVRAPGVRVASAGLVVVLALCGCAAALWQHFQAAASASCNLTLADRIVSGLQLDSALPDVFAPRASCAEAAVKLLGISYDFWALAVFVLVGLAALRALTARGVRTS